MITIKELNQSESVYTVYRDKIVRLLPASHYYPDYGDYPTREIIVYFPGKKLHSWVPLKRLYKTYRAAHMAAKDLRKNDRLKKELKTSKSIASDNDTGVIMGILYNLINNSTEDKKKTGHLNFDPEQIYNAKHYLDLYEQGKLEVKID